ncbi:hypothetical protein EHS25_005125 [Saitozyma podzolica]|uniref:BTB domain-containing protein n=1 Tax=Saitozyma podzolica TaxID=1890683 RepID=A0A427Y2H1_9TREE|nr:hypothetical protein EHS25_005125 [Saitozyma podzolica]
MNQQNQKSKGWRRSIQQDWLSWPREDKTEAQPDGRRVHARYRSGSLELVSSDDVGFRVERESVVAGSGSSSEVFRHMVDVAKPSPVYLTDRNLETAAVLAIFLDLLHGRRLPAPNDLTTRRIRELPRVYELAVKYDCPFFKDVEGCAEAIRRNGHATSLEPRHGDENMAHKDKLLEPIYGMGWADPTCWDIKNASRVDFRFHMALVRAFQRSGPCHPLSKPDLEEIAIEFQLILRARSEKEQQIHERYTTGDIEIVSSDGVCLRVNPAFLIAGSRVFRAMIEDGTSSQIQLTDEDIETEDVFALLLDFLHAESLPTMADLDPLYPFIELLSLARKYDCPAALFMIRHFLRSASVDDPEFAQACFTSLSHLGDVQGCAEAIRHGGHNAWSENKVTSRGGTPLDTPLFGEGWVFTPAWPFEFVKEADPLFVFALSRAARVVENPRTKLSKDDLSRVADEFVWLLKPPE